MSGLTGGTSAPPSPPCAPRKKRPPRPRNPLPRLPGGRHARAKDDLAHEDAAGARETLREPGAVLDEAVRAVRA
ncbi:hypothetical protein GCM10010398_39020 [Streptomyces fimbriatus]